MPEDYGIPPPVRTIENTKPTPVRSVIRPKLPKSRQLPYNGLKHLPSAPLPPRRPGSLTWLGKYLSLALTLPACVVAGYLAGAALDHWLHTDYIKVICIFLGMAGGILQIVRELNRDAARE